MRLLNRLMAAVLAGLVLVSTAPAQAGVAQVTKPVSPGTAEETGTLRFRVERGGSPIGTHALTFQRTGDTLTVEVRIDLEVGLGPLTLFRYTHHNTTTWQNGRMASMVTETNDDGEDYFVKARRMPDGRLQVRTHSGTRTVRGDILPSTYWMTGTVQAHEMLNSQKGTVGKVRARTDGTREIDVPDGQNVTAQCYRMRGALDVDIWYDGDGRWVGLAFDARGERITYTLTEASGWIPTTPPPRNG